MLLAPFLGQQGVLTHRGSSASQNTTQAVAYAQDLAVLGILKTQAACGGTFDHLILSSLRLVFFGWPDSFWLNQSLGAGCRGGNVVLGAVSYPVEPFGIRERTAKWLRQRAKSSQRLGRAAFSEICFHFSSSCSCYGLYPSGFRPASGASHSALLSAISPPLV